MNSRWECILEPIADTLPCGDDLSFSAEFDRIHEARREDDPTVDYGEWQSTLKQADWTSVVNDCSELLQKRSKDLRLAAWLTEGLVKTSGLKGLLNGVEVTSNLIGKFGSAIHPQTEEGEQERRIGTLAWFVMRMSQLVRQVPITQGKGGQFSLNDYESASHLQNQLQRNADAVTDVENKVTLERFAAATATTDNALYTQWVDDAKRCADAVTVLAQTSDQLFGTEGPSFSVLAESIDAVSRRLQSIAKDRGLLAAPETVGQEANGQTAPVQPTELPPALQGPIRTRVQALDTLRQVAAFFHTTEPHSPVAYLADKAVQWGSMPLHAWLRAVVKDHGALAHIEELLGVGAVPGEDGAST